MKYLNGTRKRVLTLSVGDLRVIKWYVVEKNILYQDNKSTILLEENGKRSSGKRTRALNVRYFFMTDQIERGNVVVEYCPTDDMIADFMSKPLQGTKFQKFSKDIMGES